MKLHSMVALKLNDLFVLMLEEVFSSQRLPWNLLRVAVQGCRRRAVVVLSLVQNHETIKCCIPCPRLLWLFFNLKLEQPSSCSGKKCASHFHDHRHTFLKMLVLLSISTEDPLSCLTFTSRVTKRIFPLHAWVGSLKGNYIISCSKYCVMFIWLEKSSCIVKICTRKYLGELKSSKGLLSDLSKIPLLLPQSISSFRFQSNYNLNVISFVAALHFWLEIRQFHNFKWIPELVAPIFLSALNSNSGFWRWLKLMILKRIHGRFVFFRTCS